MLLLLNVVSFSVCLQSYIMNFASILVKSNIHTLVIGTRGFDVKGTHFEDDIDRKKFRNKK